MLSRSIYNVKTQLDAEYKAGRPVSEALLKSLLDVLSQWHQMAIYIEEYTEEMEASLVNLTADDKYKPFGERVHKTFIDKHENRKTRLVCVVNNEKGNQS